MTLDSGGVKTPVANRANETDVAVTLAPNLFSLFTPPKPWISPSMVNSQPGQPVLASAPRRLTIAFPAGGVTVDTAKAPFDLFYFRTPTAPSTDVSWETHLPQYAGTHSMNNALFNTAYDASTASNHFVGKNGMPYVLDVPASVGWPKEGTSMTTAYPAFGVSNNPPWWTTPAAGAVYTGGTPGARPTPAFVGGATSGAITTAASCADQIKNQGESDIDCGGTVCAACGVGKSCSTGTDCAGGLCVAGSCQASLCSSPTVPTASQDFDGQNFDWSLVHATAYAGTNNDGQGAQWYGGVHSRISVASGDEVLIGTKTYKLGSNLSALTYTAADYNHPFSGEVRSPAFELGKTVSIFRHLRAMGMDGVNASGVANTTGNFVDGEYIELRDASTNAVVLILERYQGASSATTGSLLYNMVTNQVVDALTLSGTLTVNVPPGLQHRNVYLAAGLFSNDGDEAAFLELDQFSSAGFGPCGANPCTTGTCDPVAGCSTDPVADGTACGTASSAGTCDTGVCATCNDGAQNQDETGIDCGGSCDACPTCHDNKQNQGEAGIDCGGPCQPCIASCIDGIQNGDETGRDCGGSCAATCPGGPLCAPNGQFTRQYHYTAGDTLKQRALKACQQRFGNDLVAFCSAPVSGAFSGSILNGPVVNGAWTYDGAPSAAILGPGNNYFAAGRYSSSNPWIVGGPSFDGAAVTCATCSDGVQNGNEEGIDCGGTCFPCTP
jgi:hypothetical protein